MLSDEAGLRFCASGRISCQSFSSLAEWAARSQGCQCPSADRDSLRPNVLLPLNLTTSFAVLHENSSHFWSGDSAVKNTNHASDSRVDTCVTHTTLDVAGHVSANKKSTGVYQEATSGRRVCFPFVPRWWCFSADVTCLGVLKFNQNHAHALYRASSEYATHAFTSLATHRCTDSQWYNFQCAQAQS